MSHKPDEKRIILPDRSDNWLITFGDLLTLLLCFFISAWATVRMKNSQSADVTPLKHERIADKAGATVDLTLNGTRIAEDSIGITSPLLRFRAEDFRGDPEKLGPEARSKLGKVVDYRDFRWNLEVCSREEEVNNSEKWKISQRRALYLRSQLIDSGLEPEMIGVRVLGPNCNFLEGERSGVDSGIVAVSYPDRRDRN